jgi:hypothetical protein
MSNFLVASLCLLLAAGGCSFNHVISPLAPLETQSQEMVVDDDKGVTFTRDRLDVRLRPMTDEELDRLFGTDSSPQKSSNPYTFGGRQFWDGQRSRFTVFHLRVKNYAFPKVIIDPLQAELTTANGRRYWSLSLQQLESYFRSDAIGYRGNEYSIFRQRLDILRDTMFQANPVFSGQESEGYVVFPVLHDDVSRVEILIHDIALRFDYRGEPVETMDLGYDFQREIGRRLWGQKVEDADGA